MTLPEAFGPHLPWVYDGGSPSRSYLVVTDGTAKTALMYEAAIHGGTFEPLIRDTAVALMRGLPLERGATPEQHRERVQRLHAFVRDSVPYHGEAVEIIQAATMTLRDGGDCDDHSVLLCALAWALRYPFAIIPTGDPLDPYHYTTALGYPPADTPSGTAETHWLTAETTIPAALGEPLAAAAQRVGIR